MTAGLALGGVVFFVPGAVLVLYGWGLQRRYQRLTTAGVRVHALVIDRQARTRRGTEMMSTMGVGGIFAILVAGALLA